MRQGFNAPGLYIPPLKKGVKKINLMQACLRTSSY